MAERTTRSSLGLLALVGAMSLCCVSLTALLGGSAIVGGAAAGTTAAIGGSIGGVLVTGLATVVPLAVVAGLLRYRGDRDG